MALVVPGYAPADGILFSPSGWNGDFYSLVNGVSVYGELNGHVQDANFLAGQQVDARHVRPFEGFRSEFSGAMETVDFHEHLFGQDYSLADWLPIPGASKRVYLPWSPTATVFRASCFAVNFRMRQGPADGDAIVIIGPTMRVALFIDGEIVEHTVRNLPFTVYPQINPGNAEYLRPNESSQSQHFDFIDIRGPFFVAPGNHDVDLRVIVVQNIGTEELYPLYDNDPLALTSHSVTHRIRAGIRSASIIGLY